MVNRKEIVWRPVSLSLRKRAARLRTASGREKTGLFLIEGFLLLAEALQHQIPIEAIIIRNDATTRQRLETLLSRRSRSGRRDFPVQTIPISTASSAEIQELAATVTSSGVLALARQKKTQLPTTGFVGTKLLILDNIRDPGNLGAIFRCAAAFGVEEVYLSPGCVELYNPKVVRASMGTVFSLQIYPVPDLSQLGMQLEKAGFAVFVADPRDGIAPNQTGKSRKQALVIGGETAGYAVWWRKQKARPVHIPMSPGVESLNSAVAAGIILSYWQVDNFRRRPEARRPAKSRTRKKRV